ncbi:MAG: YciI family protein [Rickettsiales bacterium]|nr:YciI family protein [Rickettsiales bacterium]
MQFLILAFDATDGEALARRMANRDAHIAHIDKAKAAGHAHMGAALLDEDGKMMGSSIICEFPDEAAVEAWIKTDPYITGEVWDDVSITPCKIAPSFVK